MNFITPQVILSTSRTRAFSFVVMQQWAAINGSSTSLVLAAFFELGTENGAFHLWRHVEPKVPEYQRTTCSQWSSDDRILDAATPAYVYDSLCLRAIVYNIGYCFFSGKTWRTDLLGNACIPCSDTAAVAESSMSNMNPLFRWMFSSMANVRDYVTSHFAILCDCVDVILYVLRGSLEHTLWPGTAGFCLQSFLSMWPTLEAHMGLLCLNYCYSR